MWDAVGVGGRIEQAGFSRNYVGLNAEGVLKPTVFFHIIFAQGVGFVGTNAAQFLTDTQYIRLDHPAADDARFLLS